MVNKSWSTVRGLNPWARRMMMIENKEVVGVDNSLCVGNRVTGRQTGHVTDPRVKREKSGEYCTDIFGQYHPLYRYTLPDGRMYQEVVQKTSLLSGPVIFLALLNKRGEIVPESIWSIEEMSQLK